MRLRRPGSNDDWGDVLNDNFVIIEDTINDLDNSVGGFTTLKGNFSSFSERVGESMNDSGGLPELRRASKSRIADTSTVNERLGMLESRIIKSLDSNTYDNAPEEVKKTFATKEFSMLDTHLSLLENTNRFICDGDMLAVQYAATDVWLQINGRWYYIPEGTSIAPNAIDGKTYAFSTWRMFDDSGAALWNSTLTGLSTRLDIGNTNPVTGWNIVTENTIQGNNSFTNFPPAQGMVIDIDGEVYRVRSYTAGTPNTIQIYGAFSASKIGTAIAQLQLYDDRKTSYFNQLDSTDIQDIYNIKHLPGVLVFGMRDSSGNYSQFDSLKHDGKYLKIISTDAWGTDAVKVLSARHDRLANNAWGFVYLNTDELIYPNTWTIGLTGTDNVHVRRDDTSRVCINPSNGSDVVDSNVKFWGVVIEL